MKKVEKDGILKGYDIGKNINIHSHIKDSGSWFLTIRYLNIHGLYLCKKDLTEVEIARNVHIVINNELNIVNELIKEVLPFT